MQERSRERVLAILNEMEKLISEGDLHQISISQIAKTTGLSRTSLYRFFPTVSTIYKELGLRYMDEMEAHVRGCWPADPPKRWEDGLDLMIDLTIDYYNERPPIRKILLGSAGAAELRAIDREYDTRFAMLIRDLYGQSFVLPHKAEGDPLKILMVLLGGIYSISVLENGFIAPFYRDQAKFVARTFLVQFVIPQLPSSVDNVIQATQLTRKKHKRSN